MRISSNAVLSMFFLLYVDVFQPKWSLLVDVCSHVVVSCIFLPGGRTLRTLPSLLVCTRGGGHLPFNPVISIKRLYVCWVFVMHIHEVSYFSIVYFNVVSSGHLSLDQSLVLVICKCIFSVGGGLNKGLIKSCKYVHRFFFVFLSI